MTQMFGMIVFHNGGVAYSDPSDDFDTAYESYVNLMDSLQSEALLNCRARGVVTAAQGRDWLTAIADTTK